MKGLLRRRVRSLFHLYATPTNPEQDGSTHRWRDNLSERSMRSLLHIYLTQTKALEKGDKKVILLLRRCPKLHSQNLGMKSARFSTLAESIFSSESSWTPKTSPNNCRAAVWLRFWCSTRPSADTFNESSHHHQYIQGCSAIYPGCTAHSSRM